MREVNYDERWKAARDLSCKINLWPTVENLQHIDAALRRAKAEVWREAAIEARIESVRKDETSGYQRAARCLADTYDARAAQIEEGE